MKRYFTDHGNVPRFTKNGYLKVKCPPVLWGVIKDVYNILLSLPAEKESVVGNDKDICELYKIHRFPNIAQYFLQELLPLHEWWSGQSLVPVTLWGVRNYPNGSKLDLHHDRAPTHHISSIIMVDKDLNKKKDWPLVIQDHKGEWNEVYTEPGEIILYESLACIHGRPNLFEGNYFRNFYVHYRLKDYDYIGLNNTPRGEIIKR